MKHNIKGKHGHHYSISVKAGGLDPGSKGFWNKRKICISASEAAHSDFLSMEIRLREKLSLKWDVCMWCWDPKPRQGLYGHPKGKGSVLIGKECGIGRCKAWGKPKRVNGLLTRTKKNGA